jgi:hypothetical protein
LTGRRNESGQGGNDTFWALDGTSDVVRGGPGTDTVASSDNFDDISGTE